MLQWQDGGGSFEHRAYWGANLIALGTNGTDSRRQISGAITATGQWVRLDVPASQVGLVGQTVNGLGFTLFDGQATWDQSGRFNDQVGIVPGYLFRPGVIVTKGADVQHPHNNRSGLSGSGSANIYVHLTEAQSAEDRPDRFKCIAECRRTHNYDTTGAEIEEQYGYAPSPARAVADRFLHFFQRRFRDRLDIAQEKF
jgi:hypothetical protein